MRRPLCSCQLLGLENKHHINLLDFFQDRAQEALNFVLEHLPKADRGSHGTLIREATLLCSSYPVLFTEQMIAQVRKNRITNSNTIR